MTYQMQYFVQGSRTVTVSGQRSAPEAGTYAYNNILSGQRTDYGALSCNDTADFAFHRLDVVIKSTGDYQVTVQVQAVLDIEIEAEDDREAEDLGNEYMDHMDFGKLENTEFSLIDFVKEEYKELE